MSRTSSHQKTITSRDGTRIAYEQSGDGPGVVLVASLLSDRSDTKRLAAQLSRHFTVVNYDRRGRGKSGDTAPYAVEREVEDIDALIDAVGGSAALFGSSSGAVLALDAAQQLPGKIRRLALYEPPFIVDDSRPPIGEELSARIAALLSADRRGDAVKLFMKSAGVPAIGVALMRFMPGWSAMCAMAPTLLYDLAIMRDTQIGRPLPANRWSSVTAPTIVLTGGKSEPFFHAAARALAALLPNAEHRVLARHHHGSVVMSPKTIAAILTELFGRSSRPALDAAIEVVP